MTAVAGFVLHLFSIMAVRARDHNVSESVAFSTWHDVAMHVMPSQGMGSRGPESPRLQVW